MELTKEQKIDVVKSLLSQYLQTLYGHTTEARVARQAKLPDMEKRALASATQAQVLVDIYEKELAALVKETTETPPRAT